MPLYLILTLKTKNSILNSLTNDNFGFNIARTPFYCYNAPNKMFYESIEAEFLRISRTTSKIEDLSCTCKQLLSRVLKQNEQMRRIKFFLIKMIQRHQEVCIKYKKSIEKLMQAIGFLIQIKTKNLTHFSIYIYF